MVDRSADRMAFIRFKGTGTVNLHRNAAYERDDGRLMRQAIGWGVAIGCFFSALAQTPRTQVPASSAAPQVVTVEQPDAHRTREELSQLLGRYPPTLRNVLALDASLLSNQNYLSTYPALVAFLSAHPEVARDPAFYVGMPRDLGNRQNSQTPTERIWERLLEHVSILAGFGLAIGLLTWLIRTLIDYRRWNRLTKVQTDVHTKILDRFTGNEEMMAYIKSPAGAKFLESTPITLDAGPRSVGAPLGRILWSVQAGLVLVAGGIGLEVISGRVPDEAGQPIHALGVLAIALGLGFVVSAGISYLISQRLGLIEAPQQRPETPASLG